MDLLKQGFSQDFRIGCPKMHILGELGVGFLFIPLCNSSKFCHITPLLKTLHWLPVRQRIVFKILLIVFKALNGQAPSYILELLTLKSNSHSHNLRSSNDTLLLKMPTCKTKVTLGDRAFSCAAPKIWNNLPLSIRKSQSVTSFKTKLKTHLFVQAFQ